jgi:hypothetical protein
MLDEAVAQNRRAVESAARGNSDRGALLANLGNALSSLFEVTGDSDDLAESVAVTREALNLAATHQRPAQLAGNLANLINRLHTLIVRSTATSCRDASISASFDADKRARRATPTTP